MAEKEEVTVTVQAAGTVTADSGSEVSERNRINPSDSGKRRSQGNNFKMLNSDVSDQRLNVEAIIKNINKISLELKKINDMHQRRLSAVAISKGKRTAKNSVE